MMLNGPLPPLRSGAKSIESSVNGMPFLYVIEVALPLIGISKSEVAEDDVPGKFGFPNFQTSKPPAQHDPIAKPACVYTVPAIRAPGTEPAGCFACRDAKLMVVALADAAAKHTSSANRTAVRGKCI